MKNAKVESSLNYKLTRDVFHIKDRYIKTGCIEVKPEFPPAEFVRNVTGWRKSSLLRQPITLLNSCFRFASREQIVVETSL